MDSYVYIQVTFTSMQNHQALSHSKKKPPGTVPKVSYESMVLNTVVTPTLMYNAYYMGSNLHVNVWTQKEHHPLVTMLLEMIHGKSSTLHEII